MPYTNVARKRYDSGDYPKSLDTVRRAIDLDMWRARQRRGEPDGRRIGIGFASYCRTVGTRHQRVRGVGLSAHSRLRSGDGTPGRDGSLEVRVGVHSHGQGMETTLAQIAHEVLGIDIANIRVILATPELRPSRPVPTPRAASS